MEQLLRRALALPGRPAVAFLNWWSYLQSRTPEAKGGYPRFYRSAEADFGVLAQYYGLPRCAVHDGRRAQCARGGVECLSAAGAWLPAWGADRARTTAGRRGLHANRNLLVPLRQPLLPGGRLYLGLGLELGLLGKPNPAPAFSTLLQPLLPGGRLPADCSQHNGLPGAPTVFCFQPCHGNWKK